jgi:hypothetical protein
VPSKAELLEAGSGQAIPSTLWYRFYDTRAGGRMLIAGMGVVVVGASVAVLVLSRRWKSRGGRVVARSVAIVDLALACAVSGVYVWPLSSTDSSQMARAICLGRVELWRPESVPGGNYGSE